MKISISAFITAKTGNKISECEDAFSISTDRRVIAVSDGVSQSFYPKVWSRILCDYFTKSPEEFFQEEKQTINSDCTKQYREEVEKIFNSLPESKKRFVRVSQSKFPNGGAATFVGLQVIEDRIQIDCIGDSVLFYIFKDASGGNIIKHCCSMTSSDGHLAFDNSPEYFNSDGTKNGNVHSPNQIQVKPSTIFIMTDALSDWFNKYRKVDLLKGIRNHSEFTELIDKYRADSDERLKDDDTTMVVIDITDDGQEGIIFEDKHIDDIETLIVPELKEEIKQLEESKKILEETKNKEIDNLNSEIANRDTKIAKVEKELTDCKKELESEKKNNADLQRKLDDIQSQLNESELKYKDLAGHITGVLRHIGVK